MEAGHRVGDAAAYTDGRPSIPRAALVALVVTVLAVVYVGSALLTDGFDDYRSRGCKSLAIAEPIVDLSVPAAERPVLPSTPQDAVAAFAALEQTVGRDPTFPADGWHEDRGRWVRDMPDGTFLELDVQEIDGGWFVSTSSICSR